MNCVGHKSRMAKDVSVKRGFFAREARTPFVVEDCLVTERGRVGLSLYRISRSKVPYFSSMGSRDRKSLTVSSLREPCWSCWSVASSNSLARKFKDERRAKQL